MPFKDNQKRLENNKTYRSQPEYKELQWKRQLKIVHNISAQEYLDLLEQQNGVCAICGDPPGIRRLAIDHDHSCCPTTKHCGSCIRGLLCTNCNSGIGKLRDDPGLLRRAAEYLENN